MARTLLGEVLVFGPFFIEHQLAHVVRDPNGRAYNGIAFLPEPRRMMSVWANYLNRLKADGEVDADAIPSTSLMSYGLDPGQVQVKARKRAPAPSSAALLPHSHKLR